MLRSFTIIALLLVLPLTAMSTRVELPLSAPSQFTTPTLIESDFAMAARTVFTGGNFITVTTSMDEYEINGNCSVREAIQAANMDARVDACPAGRGGDTIYLPPGEYDLTDQITLTGAITLQGSITVASILDGQGGSRVLSIQENTTVALLHLDIRNGHPQDCYDYSGCTDDLSHGGGVLNHGATLIAYSTIHGNVAGRVNGFVGESSGADGGGIYNAGILTVTNSTITANAAVGGGCMSHGGVSSCGWPGEGGGIANIGTLMLDNVTVVYNQSGFTYDPISNLTSFGAGDGIYSKSSTTLKNSIVAHNYKDSIFANYQGSDCSGTLLSLGNNLIQTIDGCTIKGTFIHWGAHLGPLQDNGGPTLTHALGKNSPAIDAGDCTDSTGIRVTVDQRGEPRPQGDGCDIGAYESPYTSTFVINNTILPLIGR